MSDNASLSYSGILPSTNQSKVKFTLSTLERRLLPTDIKNVTLILALTALATFNLGWIIGVITFIVTIVAKATFDTISTIAHQSIDLDFDLNLVDSPASSYRHQAETNKLEDEIWGELSHQNSPSRHSQD
jgi:hypothetical protein